MPAPDARRKTERFGGNLRVGLRRPLLRRQIVPSGGEDGTMRVFMRMRYAGLLVPVLVLLWVCYAFSRLNPSNKLSRSYTGIGECDSDWITPRIALPSDDLSSIVSFPRSTRFESEKINP